MENIYYVNTKNRKSGIGMLISHKVNFKEY